jgi:2-dehydro-3-deoxy-D-gluconate 5-dehydrogenase
MVAIVDPSRESITGLFDLSGKSAVVTGGAMGIGFGIARRLAEARARVIIVDVNLEAAETSAARLSEAGWAVQAVQGDVRSATDIAAMVRSVVERHGGLDIWVNNAGVYPACPIVDLAEEVWDRVLSINLKGTFLCSQAAARQMIAQGRGGVIINIASIDAVHPSFVGLGHYDASKGGVLMFTKSLALELAPHAIRIMAIAPGPISTEGTRGETVPAPATASTDVGQASDAGAAIVRRVPLGRVGVPDDIGRVALFLASDAAAYMTGSLVFVDGGFLLS